MLFSTRALISAENLYLFFPGKTFHLLILIILKLGISMHKFGERCDLIQEGGRITDPTIDTRMDFHFNALLDVVSEWRKDKTQLQDVPLGGMGRTVF